MAIPVVLLAHLPGVRIDDDELDVGDFNLWRLPFDTFDVLTLGAWSDWRSRYEATGPVFVRLEIPLDLPNLVPGDLHEDRALEMKFAAHSMTELLPRVGLGFVLAFFEVLEDLRSALFLAAPASAPMSSVWSVAFALPEGGHFDIGDNEFAFAHVQGEADLELCFLATSAADPITEEDAARATALLDVASGMREERVLAAGLDALLGSASPILSRVETLTICVTALESVLLPEVRTGLGETFARRLSNLLAQDDAHRERLQELSRALYDARGASVHGDAGRALVSGDELVVRQSAQQLLAATLALLGALVARGKALDDLRRALDADALASDLPPGVQAIWGGQLPLAEPAGGGPTERLLWPMPAEPVAGFTSNTASMASEPGEILSWAPMLGLGCELQEFSFQDRELFLMPATADEFVSMEDKDIARDFLRDFQFEGQPTAILGMRAPAGGLDSDAVNASRPVVNRLRDLAVAALRIVGLSHFEDPELLGEFIYAESLRYRLPSVLRQTQFEALRHPAVDTVGDENLHLLTDSWLLLSTYDATARHDEVDQVLVAFRRSHDRRFLSPADAARIMFGALESMLGRFREKSERIQLEDLVTTVSPGPAAEWFKRSGRTLRNAVAHGHAHLQDETPLDHLLEVLRSAVPRFVSDWTNDAGGSGQRPSRVFIKSVTREHSR